MRAPLITLVALLGASQASAEDLTPETAAQIRRDQKKADERILKAHGNKKPQEMSKEERQDYFRERAEAHREVLGKHGVEDKDFARHEARMNKDERAETAEAEARLSAKEQADAAKKAEEEDKAKEKAAKSKEPVIQRGFDEAHPEKLDGEGLEGSEPVPVEQGLPPDEPGPPPQSPLQ